MLPEGWTITTLGEIFQHNNGKQKSSSNKEGRLLKYITTSNVYWGEFDLSNVKEMFFTNNELEKCTVTKGDLLVCEGGDVGRSAIWNYEYPICIQNHLHRLRSWLPVCTEYFFYSLMYNKFKNLIKGKGIGLMSLSSNDLHNIPINLPPVNEQKRIVAEINRWFDLFKSIENNTDNLNTLIKTTKSKVLDLAIHGKLVPQDPTDEPASELLKRINPKAEITSDNGHYQKLPEGWCECKLSDVCVFDNGYAFSSDNYNNCGIPLIRISNITNTGSINLSSCVFIQDVPSNKFIVKSGDLLIAMSGATTGKMGVYLYEENALLNQRVGNLKCTDAMLQQYRNYYMFAKSDYILKIAYGGAQPNISAKAILDIDVMLPPLKEQHRIVAKIEEIFAQLDAIEASL